MMTRDLEPSTVDWTESDRDDMARKIRIVAEKQLDLKLTPHRATVIAVALLYAGWRREATS